MTERTTPVLVVGGSVTGLSAALFLAWHGVEVTVVERRSGIVAHPRARGIHLRAMEVFRQVGLDGPLTQACSHVAHLGEWTAIRAETLAAPEQFRAAMSAPVPMDFDAYSPCRWIPIDQDRLEEVVLERASALGARVRFDTELSELTSAADGVRAVLTDLATGDREVVRAQYLIGADGYRGTVSTALGVVDKGEGPAWYPRSVLFDADLTEALDGRRIGLARLDRPSPGTMLMPCDGDRLWCLITGYAERPTDMLADEQECTQLVRSAVGVPDLPVRIVHPLAGVPTLSYALGSRSATRYRYGPVFLAGDAAHLMPPSGAFGASTGVQDAHNLAWKLAAVLRGDAGPELLDSYQAERLPAARLAVEHAERKTQQRHRSGAGPGSDEYGAAVFGYCYPVLGSPRMSGNGTGSSDGSDAGEALAPAELAGAAGSRAPHVWLSRDGDRISSLDLFGQGFVLLTESADWMQAATQLADEAPLRGCLLAAGGVGSARAVVTGMVVLDHEAAWRRVYRAGPDAAVLVRPDGFVAWRTEEVGTDPAGTLRGVLAAQLARLPVPVA